MANLRANKIVGIGSTDAGTTFDGPISLNTQGYMYFPTGTTEQRGRGRGLNGGSSTPSNITNIDYFQIQSTGNSIVFGDLTTSGQHTSCSSVTRGVFAMGGQSSPGTKQNVIDYVTIATTGNAQDFGDTTNAAEGYLACASNTRGIFVGGNVSPSGNVNTIQYVTIASEGDAVDFGDIGSGRVTAQSGAGTSNNLRGVTMGGFNNPNQYSTTMEYVNIDTTGNSFDFGYLSSSRAYTGSCSDSHGGL